MRSSRSLRKRCAIDPQDYLWISLSYRTLTALQHSSGNKKAEEDANKEADVKVKEIKDIGEKSGSKVVDQLLKAVTDVKPEPPRGRE
jgi:hypothetical protein